MLNTLALLHMIRTLIEDGEMITHHRKKVGRAGGGVLIVRIGKGRFRNMFDVRLVKLADDLMWDRKYGIEPVDGYGAVGDSMYDRHQKIFNLMSSLIFFMIVIYFFHIFRICIIYLHII